MEPLSFFLDKGVEEKKKKGSNRLLRVLGLWYHVENHKQEWFNLMEIWKREEIGIGGG